MLLPPCVVRMHNGARHNMPRSVNHVALKRAGDAAIRRSIQRYYATSGSESLASLRSSLADISAELRVFRALARDRDVLASDRRYAGINIQELLRAQRHVAAEFHRVNRTAEVIQQADRDQDMRAQLTPPRAGPRGARAHRRAARPARRAPGAVFDASFRVSRHRAPVEFGPIDPGSDTDPVDPYDDVDGRPTYGYERYNGPY